MITSTNRNCPPWYEIVITLIVVCCLFLFFGCSSKKHIETQTQIETQTVQNTAIKQQTTQIVDTTKLDRQTELIATIYTTPESAFTIDNNGALQVSHVDSARLQFIQFLNYASGLQEYDMESEIQTDSTSTNVTVSTTTKDVKRNNNFFVWISVLLLCFALMMLCLFLIKKNN